MIRAFVLAAELALSLIPGIPDVADRKPVKPLSAGGTTVSVGLESAYPGYFGLWASAWATQQLSLEAVATLSAAKFGATAHFPVYHGRNLRIALTAGADVGIAHNLVRTAGPEAQGALGSLYGGVGLLGPVDMRLTAGPSLSSPGLGWVGSLKLGVPVG